MNSPPSRAAVWGPVLLGTLAAALLAARFEVASLALLVALCGARAVRAPWPKASWFRGVATGMVLSFVLNLVLVRGPAIGPDLPFGIVASREGAARGLLVAWRLLAALAALYGLRHAWPADTAADTFAAWLAPLQRLGAPVRESRAMIWLGLRFVPLLTLETARIARLHDLRAGGPARGGFARLQRAQATVVPALVAALERAERVALSLDARHHRLRPIRPAKVPALAKAAGWALALTGLVWRG